MGSTARVLIRAVALLISIAAAIMRTILVIDVVTVLKTITNSAKFSAGIILSDLPWSLKKELIKHYHKVLLKTSWDILRLPSYVLRMLTPSTQ